MRCLIAQSDPTLCAMICDTLEDQGHTAICAETPEVALTRLKQGRFDLLVLDHGLSAREAGRLAHAAVMAEGRMKVLTLTGSEVFPGRRRVRLAPAVRALLAEAAPRRRAPTAAPLPALAAELAWLS